MGLDIICGFVLDIIFADPKWLPHPVQLIWKIIKWKEKILRRFVFPERLAGIVLTFSVVSGTTLVTGGLIFMAHLYSEWLATIISIYLCYASFSTCGLSREAYQVYRYLVSGNLIAARKAVGEIVGRDTENLSEAEVIRAAVESVAENTVDGSVSPILYACLGGAPLAWLFKASSTLDSMVGYRRPPYYYFGWASAKLDDLLNWLPARLSALFIPLAAYLLGMKGGKALKIALRDGHKHPSPNAGISESAFAGALEIQLGGSATYGGVMSNKPLLGDPHQMLCPQHITKAISLMWVTTLINLVGGLGLAYLLFNKVTWLSAWWLPLL